MMTVVRQMARGLIALIIAIVVAVSGVGVANAAAAPGAAPKNLTLVFHKKDVTIKWSALSGASSYKIMVAPRGVSGPFNYQWSTPATSINIAYTSFPYYKKNQGSGWYIQVAGANGAGVSKKFASTNSSVKVSMKGTKLIAKKSTSAQVVAKLKSCVNSGLAGAVAAGTGAVAVTIASVWVPGVNAVTAGGAAVAMAAAGTGAYVVCLATT